jgi:rSAM/selenodomain-associated transferase 2
MSRSAPLLSVVIPTLNEAASVGALLSDLAAVRVPYEAIVADGGSTDETIRISERAGARIVIAKTGRGIQLREGSETARARLLCFLHADVRLDADVAARLSQLALARPDNPCAFRLRIESRVFLFRLVEAGANCRTRLFGLPYGDQGLVLRREQYDAVGGYPAIPLMEDVAMARSLRRITRVRLLDEALTVSPRRWQREGVVRRTLRNWILLGRYLAGASPEQLVAAYRPEGRRD